MSKFLGDILEELDKIVNIVNDVSKIKKRLVKNNDLSSIEKQLEDTKVLIETLLKSTEYVHKEFFKEYDNVRADIALKRNEDIDDTPDIIDASVEVDISKTSPKCVAESTPKKSSSASTIRLVDINKLVDPKTIIRDSSTPKEKKSVQFNTTVVVISSSDDDDEDEKRAAQGLRPKRRVSRLPRKEYKTVLVDVDDNDDTPTKRNGKLNRRRQTKSPSPVDSDSSSSSSSSDADDDNKSYNWKKDSKFKQKCVVNVLRVKCEEMKEYYSKQEELKIIKKLTDLSSLEKRRKRNESSKKKKNEKNKKKTTKNKDDSDNDDDNGDSSNDEENDEKKKSEDTVEEEVEINQDDGSIINNEIAEDPLATPAEVDDEANESVAELALLEMSNNQSDESEKENNDNEDTTNINNSDNDESSADKTETENKNCDDDDDKNNKDDVNENNTKNNKTDDDNCNNNSRTTMEENKEKSSKNVEENVQNGNKNNTDESADEKSSDIEKKKDESNWKNDKLLTEKLSSDDSDVDKKRKKSKVSSNSSSDDNKEHQKKKRNIGPKSKVNQNKSNSDDEKPRKKKKDSSSSSSSESEEEKKKEKEKKEKGKIKNKKRRKKLVLSDSESDYKNDKYDSDEESSSSSSSSSSESEKEKEKSKPKQKRKRIKAVSSSDDEKSTRKHIRRVLGKDDLEESTKAAEAEERERKARIAEKQKKYNQLFEGGHNKNAQVDKVILDFDEETETELLKVDDDLVKQLKPHQADGVRFMWNACFESIDRAKKEKGSGCILAHCMGLGKTLQVITLAHTLLVNDDKTKVKKVMVVSPLNTVLNWVNEFKQWIPDNNYYDVYELISAKSNSDKMREVNYWHESGGVLIIGYNMFTNLSNPENKRYPKKMRAVFAEALVDPGPDLVICDEGHLLKNEKTNLSISMNRLKTLRRIVLTGTPLQNNLKEYYCMVQFVKPNLLGTYREYLNRFVNPITNGQYTDSTLHDIQVMRRRSHVLHKLLDGVVQRRDYAVLAPYLPPKHEYVLFITLTDTQIKLYDHYLKNFSKRGGSGGSSGSGKVSFLFVDFQALQRICTHPRVLLDKSIQDKNKEMFMDDEDESEGSLKDFIDDKSTTSTSSDGSGSGSGSDDSISNNKKSPPKKRITRRNANKDDVICLSDTETSKEWWQEYCDGDELDNLNHSSKLTLLFEILKECEQIGDKILIFSQSLYSLNVIEYFLAKIHDATQDDKDFYGFTGSWCLGLDYFRIDGSSSCDNRSIWCKHFNDPENTRARLFLISTKAGGLGINLVAANRVIIFDVSWNPSHDIQSIYRVYRFGQTKPCYVYRFVTHGTMEMKIYERQVTKQAISKRVIDEHQIDRHYNQSDLQELYNFEPHPDNRPIPLVPKDVLLGEMLQKHENIIFKYHEHQSLLENKEEETLNEEERKAAWEEFENEKQQRNRPMMFQMLGITAPHLLQPAITNILQKQNPSITDEEIAMKFPLMIKELQDSITVGNFQLLSQIQNEIQLLQVVQAQQMKDQMYRQQAYRLLQQQRLREVYQQNLNNQMAGSSRQGFNHNPTEIVELND